MGKRGADDKSRLRKGEEGYWERSTEAAHAAAQKAHSVFETVEDFQAAADAYFAECDAEGQLYGEAGLCLGLTKYNTKGRTVTLNTLRSWYDGEKCEYLKDAVQMAYMRIQAQLETDPRYQDKGGMATRAIFLQKQKRFGGYQDKQETKNDTTVRIVLGEGAEPSDFR